MTAWGAACVWAETVCGRAATCHEAAVWPFLVLGLLGVAIGLRTEWSINPFR